MRKGRVVKDDRRRLGWKRTTVKGVPWASKGTVCEMHASMLYGAGRIKMYLLFLLLHMDSICPICEKKKHLS